MSNVSSKICASVANKLKDSARQDMAIADYRMIDDSHADVLIAYADAVPSIKEIVKFTTKTFGGKAYAIAASARLYAPNKAVSIVLSAPEMTRSVSDSEDMMKITASTFMDVTDNAEWHIKTNPTTGAKYLARAMDEDFEKIVASYKACRATCPIVTAKANFETIVASGWLMANENDFVKFFDGTIQCGTIKQVLPDGETVKIVNEEGMLYTVPKTSILQIIRKDPEEQQQIDKDMENFYANIWGPEYSAELFKNGSNV